MKDSDECELNCLAKGHKFFLRLSPKLRDGTPCLSDLKKVCIDGTCKVCQPETRVKYNRLANLLITKS